MKKKAKQIKPYQQVKEPQTEYLAFKDVDVHELANKILKAIGDDKQKRAILLGLLVSDVATKQEFIAILAELKAMRKASDEKFEVMDKRFEASERRFEAIESELKAMREESERRFEATEKRFEASERRFEAIESELKAMREESERRFEATEKRFEASERRFEAIESELKAMREESERRFEATEKRFEASERRFEAIESELKAMREESERRFEATEKRFEASERRFEAIESELKAMREESERRFEATEKRFEAIEKRFEEIDKRFENQREDFHLYLKASIEALNKSLTNKISALGSRWGVMAEDTFTVAMKEILSKAGFVVTKWRKTDSNAEFFLKPRDAEIDILIKNGKRMAVEIKSTINIGDIEIFEKTVQFYEKTESVKIDEKFMVGIHLRKEVDEYASKFGIKLLSQVEDIIE